MDLANAFLIMLVDEKIAERVRGIIELTAKTEGDDPFAKYWGLV